MARETTVWGAEPALRVRGRARILVSFALVVFGCVVPCSQRLRHRHMHGVLMTLRGAHSAHAWQGLRGV